MAAANNKLIRVIYRHIIRASKYFDKEGGLVCQPIPKVNNFQHFKWIGNVNSYQSSLLGQLVSFPNKEVEGICSEIIKLGNFHMTKELLVKATRAVFRSSSGSASTCSSSSSSSSSSSNSCSSSVGELIDFGFEVLRFINVQLKLSKQTSIMTTSEGIRITCTPVCSPRYVRQTDRKTYVLN